MPARAARPSRLLPAALLLVTTAILGCGKRGGRTETIVTPVGDSTAEFAAARDAFFDEYMRRNPDHAVNLGLHAHDGKLPDVTATGVAAAIEWLRAERARFDRVAPASLEPTQILEREVLLAAIRGDLFE